MTSLRLHYSPRNRRTIRELKVWRVFSHFAIFAPGGKYGVPLVRQDLSHHRLLRNGENMTFSITVKMGCDDVTKVTEE